jgi:hypothetical protein
MSEAFDLTVINDLEKQQVLENCYKDPVQFCKTFLPEHFYREIPWVHRALLAVLTEKTHFLLKYGELGKIVKNFIHRYSDEDQPDRQIFHVFINNVEVSIEEIETLEKSPLFQWSKVPQVEIKLDLGDFTLILMPRGSSKTTYAGFAVELYKILYRIERFTLYVSEAQAHTEAQLASIKKELSNNERIHEFFGNVRPARSQDEKWASEKFETVTGVALQGRGKGSAIRGINHNNKRPSTILVDDPQNREDVKSETVRESDKKWMMAELLPARARIVGDRGKVIVLGTWLHKECLVALMAEDPRFTTIKLEVLDVDGNFIWPDYMDQKEYDAERASFERMGLLPQFYNEYHNKEMDDKDLPLPHRFIIYEPAPENSTMVCATCLDPASSKARTADFSAICTVGIQFDTGRIWLLDSHLERGMSDEDKMDEYFRQSVKWGSSLHGVEANAGQAAYGTVIKREMFIRNHYFELTMITHKTRKVDRIRAALRPRYSSGHIRHRVRFPEHEKQMMEFRYDDSHLHDDGPDCEAMCIVLLDPTAAFNAKSDPGVDQFKDKYDDDWTDEDEEYEVDDDYNWAS